MHLARSPRHRPAAPASPDLPVRLATCSLSPAAFPPLAVGGSLDAVLEALEQRPATTSPRSPATATASTQQAEVAAAFAAGQRRRMSVTPTQLQRDRSRLREQQRDHMRTLERLQKDLGPSADLGQAFGGGAASLTAADEQQQAQAGRVGPARKAPPPPPRLGPVFQAAAAAGGAATQLVPLHSTRLRAATCEAPAPAAAVNPAAADPAPAAGSAGSSVGMRSATSRPGAEGGEGGDSWSPCMALGCARSTAVSEEALVGSAGGFLSFAVGVQGLQPDSSTAAAPSRPSRRATCTGGPLDGVVGAGSSSGVELGLPTVDSRAALLGGEKPSAGGTIPTFHYGSSAAPQQPPPLLSQLRQALQGRLHAQPKQAKQALADAAQDVAPKRRGRMAGGSADENNPLHSLY